MTTPSHKKTTNSLDDWARSLSQNFKPERPLPTPPWAFFLFTTLTYALTLSLILGAQPLRPTWAEDLREEVTFLTETLLLTFGGLICALVGLNLSIPGSHRWLKLKAIGLLPTLLFICLLLYGWFLGASALNHGSLGERPACHIEVFLISLLPLGMCSWWLQKSFSGPFQNLSTLHLFVASVTPPLALMQLACLYQPQHNVLYHLLPAALALTLAWLLSRWVQKRNGDGSSIA